MERIADTARALDEWVAGLKLDAGTLIAYEEHTGRGYDASEALSMAAGVYLTTPCLLGRDVYGINPDTAKAAWGGNRLKRADAKIAVVQWARREFGIALADDQDAIADALAVCMAAWGKWRDGQNKAACRPLFGPGSRAKSIYTAGAKR